MSKDIREVELSLEIERIKVIVGQMRLTINLNIDSILARLSVLQTGSNESPDPITDWETEVNSWLHKTDL